MKKFFITISIIFPCLGYAQDLNQPFLDSLPEDMQKDISSKLAQQNSTEDPVYRSLSSQTELEKRELMDLKNRLQDDLEYLEKKLNDSNEIKNKYDLELFGSSFFSTYQSTYMPINEPNMNPSYILDSGDTIEIQLIGQMDLTETYLIKRDGTINLSEIGPLVLAGMTLSDATAYIKSRVDSIFVGTKSFVTLTNLRDINVLVSGSAFNPGIYTVSGNSNMLHVLGVAGGINDYGSYREIQLIRNNVIIETLDMYDVLITGNYDPKITIESGDVIFVRPVKKIVSITGAIKIPGRYELLNDQNLYDVIEYANKLTNNADLDNIYLDRILDGKIKSLPIRNINQFKNIVAEDGDVLYVRKHSFRSINIVGAVLNPGKYLMSEDESLSDLIKKSGGYSKNAYPFGAIYENQGALQINKLAKEKLYQTFLDNIISVSQKNPSGDFDMIGIIELTKEIKNSQPNGRVVIDLSDQDFSDSLILKEGDQLTIPEKSKHIFIYGAVNYEGAFRFQDGVGVDYFINKSGGLKDSAHKESIYVLHPNGETQKYSAGRRNIFQNQPSSQEMVLYPGSVIYVPKAIDNSAVNRLAAQAYVSILGSIGIALASLSSINNK